MAEGLKGETVSPEAIKIKVKKAGQRACDERDAKGKLCVGHLKRWDTPGEEVVRAVGQDVLVFRCERCRALYRPAPDDRSTAGLNFEERKVNILGDTVVCDP
jgi:hypothetical protein